MNDFTKQDVQQAITNSFGSIKSIHELDIQTLIQDINYVY